MEGKTVRQSFVTPMRSKFAFGGLSVTYRDLSRGHRRKRIDRDNANGKSNSETSQQALHRGKFVVHTAPK
jgi:hypothetical protein